ncbi:hypothetical protein [Streptomyces sp. bgisy082]|uniref:hypothetical protein n=1 Tax=Streptomyces sp. bgisy082 TaxID=3413776 RepID=UPI003D7660CE
MFTHEDLSLTDADTDRFGQAHAELHAARSAVKSSRVLAALLIPALAPTAAAAAQASYALHNAADTDTLTTLRKNAAQAAEAFVTEASRHFA